MNKAQMEKQTVAFRYWLLGRNYFTAVKALEVAQHYHVGLRKDGITPEFTHPLSVAMYIQTLEPLMVKPEATIAAAILHDVPEDYGVSLEELKSFGRDTLDAVETLTKEFRGVKKPTEQYFAALAKDPCGSLAKGSDRIHNVKTMVGVFTKEKQTSYIVEARDWILPMLKEARRNFPEQHLAYENVKNVLTTQMDLITAMNL